MDVNRQITGIRENDPVVMRYVYTSNYPRVEAFVIKNSGEKNDAKDIYQEAFVAAWRNIVMGRFEAENENALSAYILRIAKNKWLDHLRSVKTRTTILTGDIEKTETVDEPLQEDELDYLKKVETHFRSLGDPCHDLLNRFYFQQQRLREIATFFSWTEATAKNNKYRCLEKLRSLVIKKT